MIAVLASCSPGAHVWNTVATPRDRMVAEVAIEAFRGGDEKTLTALFVPELRARIPQLVRTTRPALPQDRSVALDLIEARYVKNIGTGVDHLSADFQLSGRREQVWVRVVITHRGGRSLISALRTTAVPVPLQQRNAFALSTAGPSQIAVLLGALLAAGTTIAAWWALARARGARRRWLWALGSFLGLGQCSVDWASGAVRVLPVHVGVFSVQVFRTGPIGPWMIGCSLPLVALIVLWRFGWGGRREARADA